MDTLKRPIKIAYVANFRLPTEKAHGVQVVKMCDDFAASQVKLTLIYQKRKQINKQLVGQNLFKYYGVKKTFTAKKIPNIDLLPLHQIGINTGPIAFLVQELSFSLVASISLIRFDGYIFTRVKLVALFMSLWRKDVIYEAHDSASNYVDKLVARSVFKVITISKSITSSWQAINASTFEAYDAVSPEFFRQISKSKAREALGLPTRNPIVIHTGNLYMHKGVQTILNTAEKLPEIDFYFVGGSIVDKNIEPIGKLAKLLPNVRIVGHEPYRLIPTWLYAADMLIIANSARTQKSNRDTSPLKLFEYLATGKTILASKVPAITEVVNSDHVYFFKPDSPASLKKTITEVIKNQENHLNKNSITLAKRHTWEKRAKQIMLQIIG